MQSAHFGGDQFLIYTDGACLRNPGPGGFAAIVKRVRADAVLSSATILGGERLTTNNRMELKAAILALQSIPQGKAIPAILRSDSRIVVDGMNTWRLRWIENGWRSSAKKPILNRDLWEALIAEADQRYVTFQWVQGHGDDPDNCATDQLANAQARLQEQQ